MKLFLLYLMLLGAVVAQNHIRGPANRQLGKQKSTQLVSHYNSYSSAAFYSAALPLQLNLYYLSLFPLAVHE